MGRYFCLRRSRIINIMKIFFTFFALIASKEIIPDDAEEVTVTPCNDDNPWSKTANEIDTLAVVTKVFVSKCTWVGSFCGLQRGEQKNIYIQYEPRNADQKFNGKVVKRFPKKSEARDGTTPATVDVCGYLSIALGLCAPFQLPNMNACNQGLTCEDPKKPGKGPKIHVDDESNIVNVGMVVDQNYPTVKVVAKWQVTDQTNSKAPPLFCVYIPLAVL